MKTKPHCEPDKPSYCLASFIYIDVSSYPFYIILLKQDKPPTRRRILNQRGIIKSFQSQSIIQSFFLTLFWIFMHNIGGIHDGESINSSFIMPLCQSTSSHKGFCHYYSHSISFNVFIIEFDQMEITHLETVFFSSYFNF